MRELQAGVGEYLDATRKPGVFSERFLRRTNLYPRPVRRRRPR